MAKLWSIFRALPINTRLPLFEQSINTANFRDTVDYKGDSGTNTRFLPTVLTAVVSAVA